MDAEGLPVQTVASLTFYMGRYKELKHFHSGRREDLDTEYRVSRRTKVVNALGMHARPAAKIAEMAGNATGNIRLSNGTSEVDASSIIDILTLCAVTGTEILIVSDAVEDSALADEIKSFFDMGFGENQND